MKNFLIVLVLIFFSCSIQAQETKKSIDANDVEIWVDTVAVSSKGDSVTVKLFLQSYLKNAREFRLNTFASGVSVNGETPLLYASIQMGKVSIQLKDRQNYLNYLLNRDEAVLLTIKTANWKKQWGKPKMVKLTFEDHEEEGKFLEYLIEL